MKFKKGMVAWSCWTLDGKVDWEEWILRSFRRGNKTSSGYQPSQRAYFVQKIPGITWVKLSKKHFDYGWAKSIPSYYRKSAYVKDGKLPFNLYSTKLQAARAELKRAEKDLKETIFKCESDFTTEEWQACIDECKRDVSAARRNLTRVKNARKK